MNYKAETYFYRVERLVTTIKLDTRLDSKLDAILDAVLVVFRGRHVIDRALISCLAFMRY